MASWAGIEIQNRPGVCADIIKNIQAGGCHNPCAVCIIKLLLLHHGVFDTIHREGFALSLMALVKAALKPFGAVNPADRLII